MARSQDSWNKKEREKKKQKEKQEKAERKAERKNQPGGKSLEDMMAYIDENGNLTTTPPDPTKKVEVKLEDIVIGVPKASELEQEDPIRTGIVSFFNTAKGFGFIRDLQTQESIFVHINACIDRIGENNKVQFEVERGPRGLQAARVKLAQ